MPGHVNEALWDKAKAAVDHKKYPDDDSYYAIVTTVYKNMGGKFKHMSKYDGIVSEATGYNLQTKNRAIAEIMSILSVPPAMQGEIQRQLHKLWDNAYMSGQLDTLKKDTYSSEENI